ncbi:MAG: hypothetical protein ACYSOP_06600 [Planctomycetota bacterium]|jgi:hypothetical protein
MNLKTTCKIALVITLVSVLLTMAGHVLIYLPALIRHLHFSIIFNAGLGLLASLLKSGGFALFLLALLQRLKNPVANTTPLIALAGILVLLGTLISMGMSMMHIGMLYKHFPFARFLLHAATTGFYFLAGAGMGMLILTQISGRSLAKPLAAVTLLVTIILGGLIFISYGTNAGIFRSIGSAAMSFGYLAILAAELLFLLAWLKQKPQPPEAGVIDPSPEPVPTLSTKAELPEL